MQTRDLTTIEYWDGQYLSPPRRPVPVEPEVGKPRGMWRVWPLSSLRRRLLPYVRSYSESVLWDHVYARFLSRAAGLKAVEIGSAPGTFLAELARRFGVVPYGIEYAAAGVELNRQLFQRHRVPTDQVIHEDFFSDRLHAQYREYFDVVVSRGFIEHFEDPRAAVERHVNLLKPGGTLIVQIPNLRGLNFAIQGVLDRRVLALHNLSIMDRRAFRALFDDAQLQHQFCDYVGAFTFDVFNVNTRPRRRALLRACHWAQLPLNVLFHLTLRGRIGAHRSTSPRLVYVGVKRASS
jgi:SAM-dependent methyltransferase